MEEIRDEKIKGYNERRRNNKEKMKKRKKQWKMKEKMIIEETVRGEGRNDEICKKK